MNLSILVGDKTVYKDHPSLTDRVSYSVEDWANSPIGSDGPPANVHALQWLDEDGQSPCDAIGHIEFTDGTPNEIITKLPRWAKKAVKAWNKVYKVYRGLEQRKV